jgi:CO/xanthine dehydrogenase FAD-binding subunit
MFVSASDQAEAISIAARGGVFGAGLTAMAVTFGTSDRIIVDLTRLNAMQGIVLDDRAIRIGALTTLEALRRSADIRAHIPEMASLLPYIASVQVRNRGTIGGNIAWQNGDLVPVLIARRARLLGPALDVAVEDYDTGLIAEIVIPTQKVIGLAEKVGHRAAFSPTLVTVAATVCVAKGHIEACHMAIGGGAPAFRLARAEHSLSGVQVDAIDWQALQSQVMAEIATRHHARVAAKVLVHLLKEKLA